MIYVFFAEGFEEIEALTPVDILRRAGIEVVCVGIDSKNITGAHGITVLCDAIVDDIKLDKDCQAIILPGGMPGTKNLDENSPVQKLIAQAYDRNIIIGAICAAPSILGKKGLLNGKKATCFPGFEKFLLGASLCDEPVCIDGNIITARGAGVAAQFGFALLSSVTQDTDKADKLKADMQYTH